MLTVHANIEYARRIEPLVRRALATYRERFVAELPEVQQRAADFSRPAFLTAGFYLVARKNRVTVRLLCGWFALVCCAFVYLLVAVQMRAI